MTERPAPLVLVVDLGGDPVEPAPFGSYASVARSGRQLLARELSRRLGSLGVAVAPLHPRTGDDPFHWGRWFAAAARVALREARAGGRSLDSIGYAGAGSLALADDDLLDAVSSAVAGEVVANNRFSADAFSVAGDLDVAIAALEACPDDNTAPRCLESAGFVPRDLAAARWARFDVDTPLDLALLRLAGRLPGTRRVDPAVGGFLEMATLPGGRSLEVPGLADVGAVLRDRDAQLVVAGRIPSSAWRYLETESACRVRCFVEERGMRSARGTVPRSLLADWMSRLGPADLVAELARLGDAVILDSRVLMAAMAGSASAEHWPPDEERFASDFGDVSRISTPWLAELTAAATAAAVPFMLGGHALVSDGLHLIIDAAWLGR